MSWHLCGYTALQGPGPNLDTPAIPDGIIPITNGHFIPNTPTNLLFAAGMSLTNLRMRLNFPKARQISPKYIRPIHLGILPGQNPDVMGVMDQPFRLNAQEEIALEATNATGTTEQVTAFIGIGDQLVPPPMGDLYTARFTSTTTSTANAWSLLTAVYEQNFLAGTYMVTMVEIFSTNMKAFRAIFDQQFFRPGFIGGAVASQRLPYQFTTRDLGVWGQFRTVTLPRFEVLTNAADSSFEGYMEMIRIGD